MAGRRLLAMLIAILLGPALAGAAFAQAYPSRPITMIVPFPAGGATDTLARFLAEKMRAILGQPIIIENVGGAAGSIGVGRAVRSPADGYTLSIGTSTTHMLTGGLYALPVRSAEGSRADHPDRQRAASDRRQEEPAGRRSERADRLAQGQSRQGVGRHRRRRRYRPSHRHLVPEGDRHQIPVRALSRQCARRCRICWRNRSIS